ncbi:MAG: M20/M25/M40 family metallo-hydrolase [Clostridia bacterium]|nr:M20/M25/M40 family metallo-hydrolase [Clostridia bacterium]
MNNSYESLAQEIVALSSVMSVSGYEARGMDEICRLLGKGFDRVETDAVGNCFLWKYCGRDGAPKILVDTHFDEIGMLVREILTDGFVRLVPIGGLSPSVLQAADVILYGKEAIRGVIVSTPPHLRSADENRLPDCEELLVDTGYPKEELEALLPIGSPVGFAPVYRELLSGRLAGKSFDNKACAAIAAHAISSVPKEKLAGDVVLMLSSYEETSRLGGASAGAFSCTPDYAMVIDVNLATVPDVPKVETVPLGGGLSISVSAATDLNLTRAVQALCKARGIAHTMIAAASSTGTNATSIQLVDGGIPTVDIGLPLRNMHTYNEVIDLSDAEALCSLVEAFVCDREIADRFCGREELPR